jgi:hypothetical protein
MQYFHFQLFFNSGASNSGTSSLTSKFGNGVFKKVYGKTVFGTMDGEVMKTLKTLMIFINQSNIFRYYLESKD